jgi:hypothetical protein
MRPLKSELRISDLKARVHTPTRLMNVKVPTTISNAIDRLAKELDASKTDVFIALLNAGLETTGKKPDGRRAAR